MDVLFLGLVFCDQSLQEAYQYSKCGLQMACHLFQKRLLDGFGTLKDMRMRVLNVPPTGSFPIHYKKLYSKAYQWEGNAQVGFVNLPVIKWPIQARKLYRLACQWAESCSGTGYVVLYSPYGPFMKVAFRLKKRYPHVRVCLIQTDPIPGRGDIAGAPNSKGDRIVEMAKAFDGFVVLTEPLLETLEAEDRPYTVVECLCDASQKPSTRKAHSENIFLYTGVTERIYGICDVARAIAQLPEAQLWVAGVGEADEELRALAKDHPNIRHFGFVNQERLAELRDGCDFLINPRRPTGTYTKYSFPSKTAEYMMSGKPVVMYKLEGVPDEYDGYLHYLTGADPETIRLELEQLIRLDYQQLLEQAAQGRRFMAEQKNAPRQAEKIKKLLERL